MPYALLNPDGSIKHLVPKPSPMMQIAPGERLVKYNPPRTDEELEVAAPVLPVDPALQEVQFQLVRRPVELAWRAIRSRRDQRLRDSDFSQIGDVPLTLAQRQAWRDYRQALRDITTQPDPHNIVWPAPPA
jgi:hypothetical protein